MLKTAKTIFFVQ